MSVIHKEENCHTLIVKINTNKVKKNQLKKTLNTIVYKVMNMKMFEGQIAVNFFNRMDF